MSGEVGCSPDGLPGSGARSAPRGGRGVSAMLALLYVEPLVYHGRYPGLRAGAAGACLVDDSSACIDVVLRVCGGIVEAVLLSTRWTR